MEIILQYDYLFVSPISYRLRCRLSLFVENPCCCRLPLTDYVIIHCAWNQSVDTAESDDIVRDSEIAVDNCCRYSPCKRVFSCCAIEEIGAFQWFLISKFQSPGGMEYQVDGKMIFVYAQYVFRFEFV